MTKIQHKRSSVLVSGAAKAPTASQLDYGELAINYSSTDPQLFIKDSSGSVISILSSYAPLAGADFTGNVSFDANVVIKGDSTNGSGELTLNCEINSHAVKIKGPAHSASANYTLTLPTSAGSSSQVLTTDGSGNLSWAVSSMSTADKTKLDGIETGATADQTGAEIKSLYEAEADTNAFTDALLTKLNNIDSGAQVNVPTNLGSSTATTNITITSSTGTDVTIDEASGTIAGLMSTTHHNKLDGIETGATADQTAAEILALLLTVDGSGSGLDADTLDGTEASALALKSGTTFTGAIGIANGSAAAPSLYLSASDTDTGIYRPAPNNFGIATGGTAAVTIDSSQRVGIGITSPNYELHVHDASGSSTIQLTNGTVGSASTDGARITGSTNGILYFENLENAATVFTTNDTERVRLDGSGRLLAGTSSARTDFFNQTWTPKFQFEGTSDQASSMSLTCNAANTQRPVLIFAKTRGTTVGSDGLVANGDGLGLIAFMGSDGSENVPGAYIGADLDGTPGVNDMPTRIRFSTCADGASSPTERMRISSDGMVHIYTNDIKVRDITVGRGPANISTDTVLGEDALTNRTTGVQSVAVGSNALEDCTTGNWNVAVGYYSLRNDTTGYGNTSVGAYSLQTLTTASFCCAFGTSTLENNNAWYNNAFGKDALKACTTGSGNSAFGYQAMKSHTTGSNNAAFGVDALKTNTTSWSNAAFGAFALRDTTTGGSNTAIGRNAMLTNTSGYQNTAVGRDSLHDNTYGLNNNCLGYRSLRKNTTGSDNVAIGRDSGYFNTTGSGNISIGVCNSSGSYAPVFGLGTSNNRIAMGSTAVTNAYVQVAWTVVSDARDKMNFDNVPHGLEFIKQLNPVAFQFKFTRDSSIPNGPVRYGFKAQDILALEGEDNAVIIDNDDPDKLRYNGEALVPVLVNAIKEQQVIIDALLARIDAAGI